MNTEIDVDVDSSADTAGTWSATSGVTATEGIRVGGVLTEFERFPHRRRLKPDTTPGEDVAVFADEVGLPERADHVVETVDVNRQHGTRRYYEQTICPGDDVYVYGSVTADEDAARPLNPDDARISAPDDAPAVLSPLSEEQIQSRFERGCKVRLVAGAVLSLVTMALLGFQAIRAGFA